MDFDYRWFVLAIIASLLVLLGSDYLEDREERLARQDCIDSGMSYTVEDDNVACGE